MYGTFSLFVRSIEIDCEAHKTKKEEQIPTLHIKEINYSFIMRDNESKDTSNSNSKMRFLFGGVLVLLVVVVASVASTQNGRHSDKNMPGSERQLRHGGHHSGHHGHHDHHGGMRPHDSILSNIKPGHDHHRSGEMMPRHIPDGKEHHLGHHHHDGMKHHHHHHHDEHDSNSHSSDEVPDDMLDFPVEEMEESNPIVQPITENSEDPAIPSLEEQDKFVEVVRREESP